MKRVFDFLCAACFLLFFSWLFLIVFLSVRLFLGSPAVFKQARTGYQEKEFRLYKFRSMNNARDESGVLLPDALRLTRFGKFLRKTSLDELPQLFNILKGNMSFVGPRPLLVEYLPLYNAEQRRRHLVKPGITGWAQVNGRNTLSWEEKFKLDCWYVDHTSFHLDLKIVWLTILKVLRPEGIHQPGQATMEKFKGDH